MNCQITSTHTGTSSVPLTDAHSVLTVDCLDKCSKWCANLVKCQIAWLETLRYCRSCTSHGSPVLADAYRLANA